MQQCPNCGHPNRAGVVFCEHCGASLIGKMPLDTKSLNTTASEEESQPDVDSSVLVDVRVQGSSVFGPGDTLKLQIEGSPEPIEFEPKAEAIFGRRDPATGAMPDVDLTPFAGYRMGVSRRHAAIRTNEEQSLDVWDLGSSNGTFLNGQRLSAHRPYRLHNGDELRLGQMQIRVIFVSSKKDTEPAPAKDKDEKPSAAEPAGAKSVPPVPRTLPVSKEDKSDEPAEAATAPAKEPASKQAPDAPSPAKPDAAAHEPATAASDVASSDVKKQVTDKQDEKEKDDTSEADADATAREPATAAPDVASSDVKKQVTDKQDEKEKDDTGEADAKHAEQVKPDESEKKKQSPDDSSPSSSASQQTQSPEKPPSASDEKRD